MELELADGEGAGTMHLRHREMKNAKKPLRLCTVCKESSTDGELGPGIGLWDFETLEDI